MANIVYVAASLDGYIADAEDGLDWLMSVPNPEGSDYGFAAFMERVDALVMGRRTFEVVLGFGEWPYTKPVFVLSSTLESVPDQLAGKAEIVTGPLPELIEGLAARGYRDLYVDGGRVIQSFLAADMIDEMIITTVAEVLGGGIPLFGMLEEVREFRHVETDVLGPQLVKNRYLRVRDQGIDAPMEGPT